MEPRLELRPVQATHVHPPPNLARVSPFLAGSVYAPSPDGINLNLVILLHGLGDTAAPFAHLAKSLNLPQTATLSLKAPERIPLLDEEAYAWWPSFDDMGELIVNPNPAATLHLLVKLVEHLTAPVSSPLPSPSPSTSTSSAPTSGGCGWEPSQIHLFGYAQGGTCAGELALAWPKARPPSAAAAPRPRPSSAADKENVGAAPAHLGSLVAVSAPLLSYPTPPASRTRLNRTRALVLYRPHEERAVGLASWQRGFPQSTALRLTQDGEGMLRGRSEWLEVMRFWSEVLGRKSALELQGDDVYEVTGGAPGASQ